ncbi:hypothetical protein MtrunA17_Chr1g0174041 [Medicago truncatula]|uniref:PPR containing plant protein n=1 Tax=Medicago truncatula TaxID=3880 RepID=G7I8M1_MEDTR|nr:PPR containing plant protein [Medicago truncatula]RHN79160.1 hypothetical protein MtrunA17_Chr1g0174041 [Medicago truncatula]
MRLLFLEQGDAMIDGTKSAGYGAFLDKKAYFDFLILCGVERIDHALKISTMMKADGCEPDVKTYDFLMKKLGAHDRVDKVNSLSNEACSRGFDVTPKEYVVDPRFSKKKENKTVMGEK